ncbi:PAS domain-containing sensor histidine kinase [Thermomonas brevis]|uniref:histidine kinase n=2 Tax=Thermomonas brevis TaxID=215691 RepID=A0A7G9QXX3_9GAMM|nr:PAS domain-containing sensor histidine kinase [Thermomonas brevis]QNN48198.1 PAS domain-containing sensor histidine kinase [Thermomonas brevis]
MIAIAIAGSAAAAAATALLARWLPGWIAALLAAAVVGGMVAAIVWRALVPMRALFRALAGTVASYRDGDFSFGITWDKASDLIELVDAHNALGNALREQRLALVQRELLLDTMVQNTPVAMVLVDPAQRIVLGNLAARRMLGEGRRLEGRAFEDVLATANPAVREAFARGGDGMFTVGSEDDEDIYHLSRRSFRLNGRIHELLLLRQLTAELRRQEVQTWKKVIRVISHELNNSLAPIASLAHSGAELLRRGQHERLPAALATIEDRARHLEGFIRDYARFAKLPAPRTEPVAWRHFIAQLRTQVQFVEELQPEDGIARFDAAQLEQALINLLKNAHESGTSADEVRLSVRHVPDGWRIDVLDRGSGMNDAVLANALLPFYSTKRHGTGLGLALAREIAEAHGGRIALLNRDGGGLCVSLVLPS